MDLLSPITQGPPSNKCTGVRDEEQNTKATKATISGIFFADALKFPLVALRLGELRLAAVATL